MKTIVGFFKLYLRNPVTLLHVLVPFFLASCYDESDLVKQSEATFIKTYGGVGVDVMNDMIQSSDGGFVLAGYSTSFSNGGKDWFIVKTDGSGNQLWQTNIGGIGDDEARAIVESNGNYAVAGFLSNGSGNQLASVAIISESGSLIDSISYNIPGRNLSPNDIVHFSYGGYMVVGSFSDGQSSFLIDLDESLSFRRDSVEILGATDTYNGTFIGQRVFETSDPDKVVVISTSGFRDDPVNLQSTNITIEEYFVNGIGLKGNGKSFGDTNSNIANSGGQLFDEGYILCGSTINNGVAYPTLVRSRPASSQFEELWSTVLLENPGENILDVSLASDGGYLLATSREIPNYGSDIGLIKTDVNGNIVWQNFFGSSLDDTGIEVIELEGGQILIGGVIGFDIGSEEGGNLKMCLIKTNKFGELKP